MQHDIVYGGYDTDPPASITIKQQDKWTDSFNIDFNIWFFQINKNSK